MWPCFANNPAGQLVGPMVLLRRDIVNRRREKDVHATKFSDPALLYELSRFEHRRIEQIGMRHTDAPIVCLSSGDNGVAFHQARGHWLFNKYVCLAVQALNRHWRVRSRRRTDV